MGTLHFILGFIALFFVVGFFITRNKDFVERAMTSIVISLTLNILIGLALGFFGLFNSLSVWTALLSLAAISFIVFLKQEGLHKRSFSFEYDKKEIMLLIIFFAIIFLLIFNVHYTFLGNISDFKKSSENSYPFPYHFDEWSHVAQARYIMEEGKLPFVNPYFYKFKEFPNNDVEVGFHVFLAEYFTLTGVNPVLHYQHLPALFTALSALFLYLLIKRLHSKTAGFIGMILFASIKSNVNILGNWFFAPSSFVILFLFSSMYFLLNKKLIFLVITIVVSAFIYPPIAIFIIISSLYFFVKNKKYYFLFLGLIAMFALAVAFFRIPYLIDLLSLFVFSKGWTFGFEFQNVEFNLFLLTFGFYGFFTTLNKKEYKAIWFFALLNFIMLVLYSFFSFSFIIPEVRATYFLQITFSIFAAVGILNLINLININKGVYKNVILLIMFIVLVIVQFSGYYTIDNERYLLYQVINESEYDALSTLTDQSKLVMADAITSIAVYPVTGNNVISLLASNMGSYNRDPQFRFYTSDSCRDRKAILDNRSEIKVEIKAQEYYIISREPIACNFFKEIYNKKGIYMYTYSVEK